VAVDDTFFVVANEGLDIGAASGLLANDEDSDGDSLSAAVVSPATNGVASVNADGSFTYTANADFFGIDTFTYTASDATTTSNLATVTINVDDGVNEAPVANDDDYIAEANEVLTVAPDEGVLANDTDEEGDTLTASLVDPPSNGTLSFNPDGSFTYTPDRNFSGDDEFTYTASDGTATSDVGRAVFNVTLVNPIFGPAVTGSFEDSSVLGIRTDLVPGAPPITAGHVDGDVDYTGYSNPPTYGDHHGFDPQGLDSNPGITPRPTGVYTEEQPDEDILHNLEHGHVWISYDPDLIGPVDLRSLEDLVLDGSPNDNGGGVGVILTPRAANDNMVALASWARLQTMDTFDSAAIRNFIEINRGKAPEGFITP
jgi:hypothetical protein